MAMIPYHHQTGIMILGICKHVLISFCWERPLQLRLRTNSLFVTKFVKINTNLYPFWWVLAVLKYILLFFSLTWLFNSLIFNLLRPAATSSYQRRDFRSFSLSFTISSIYSATQFRLFSTSSLVNLTILILWLSYNHLDLSSS